MPRPKEVWPSLGPIFALRHLTDNGVFDPAVLDPLSNDFFSTPAISKIW